MDEIEFVFQNFVITTIAKFKFSLQSILNTDLNIDDELWNKMYFSFFIHHSKYSRLFFLSILKDSQNDKNCYYIIYEFFARRFLKENEIIAHFNRDENIFYVYARKGKLINKYLLDKDKFQKIKNDSYTI